MRFIITTKDQGIIDTLKEVISQTEEDIKITEFSEEKLLSILDKCFEEKNNLTPVDVVQKILGEM